MSGLFESGVDIPLTYSFDTAGSGPAGLTSGGVAVTYTITSTLITASAGATDVFTLSLDPVTGAWTFTLKGPLDHETLDGLAGDNTENDLLLQFGNLIQATDFDGDTVTAPTGAFEITVDDDMPRYVAQATSTGLVDEDFVPNGVTSGPARRRPGWLGDSDGQCVRAVPVRCRHSAHLWLRHCGQRARGPDVGWRGGDVHDHLDADHGVGRCH